MAAEKHRSGEHRADADCGQRINELERRVDNLETSNKETGERLHAGELLFLGIKKDVETLTKAVTELSESIKAGVRWVLCLCATIASVSILYAFVAAYNTGHFK